MYLQPTSEMITNTSENHTRHCLCSEDSKRRMETPWN